MRAAAEHRLDSGSGPQWTAPSLTPIVATAVAALLLCLCIVSGVLAAPSSAAEPPEYFGAFGPDGTAATDFTSTRSVAVDQNTGFVYVLDRLEQALYKFDELGQPVDFSGSAPYITDNKIGGLALNPGLTPNQVAVDSAQHVIYVTSGNGSIRAFEASGEPHIFGAGPGSGSSEIPGSSTVGIAVDSDGNIYASDPTAARIRIYTSAGAFLTEMVTQSGVASKPGHLAVTPEGDVLTTSLGGTPYRYIPSAFPVTGSTTYSQAPKSVSRVQSFSVGVDPSTGYIYLAQRQPESERARVAVYEEDGTFLGSRGAEGQEGDFGPVEPTHGPRAGAVAVRAGGRMYVTVEQVASEEVVSEAKVHMFRPFQFFVGPPTISATAALGLTSTSATLQAKINPNTLETTYRFEYGPGCGSPAGACTQVPVDGKAIGAGHEPVRVTLALNGLSPDTTYNYRVVAENSEETTVGPLRSFTTQGTSLGYEPMDNRVWEQVTPVEKFGGAVENYPLVQAAADGNGFVVPSRGPIVENPMGNRGPERSSALARRIGAGQWQIEDLSPLRTESNQANFAREYKLFSPQLDRAVLDPKVATPLSVEASELTPYLRTNTAPPTYRPLVTSEAGYANVPPGTVFGAPILSTENSVAAKAANEDLTAIVIRAHKPLVPGAVEGPSVSSWVLYLWRDGNLTPVSVLPANEGGELVAGGVGSGEFSIRHAVSDDGSRVYWNPSASNQSQQEVDALYVRDTVREETARINTPATGVTPTRAPTPTFGGASADGSVAFFTDTRQLTADASPDDRDLYRCEVGDIEGSLGCVDLANLSVAVNAGESAGVERLITDMSDDGESVYFVARGVLDGKSNQSGEGAQPGDPNLYLWRQGSGVRFIARLSVRDATDWGLVRGVTYGKEAGTSAFSSPSGRYLTFMSQRNLTGAESDDPVTGEPTQQAFYYDSLSESLQCLSCESGGGTLRGHLFSNVLAGASLQVDLSEQWNERLVGAVLPEPVEDETAGYTAYWPRAVLDNGRAFFNAPTPLVAADSNATWDVYQYEPFGVGSCGSTSVSASVAVLEDGCIALISSGTDEDVSLFMDASASGDDLFIGTYDALSPLDSDAEVDVYDARVNGVAAVATHRPDCLGEACQPPPSTPADPTPSSASFVGPGNASAKPGKHCRRGERRAKRQGKVRCVRRHHKNANQGAGR